MRRWRGAMLCVALLGSLTGGCDRSDSTSSTTSSSSPPSPSGTVIQPGSFSIRGEVKYDGPAPAAMEIDNSICKHAGKIADESVVAGPAGELRNVVVYLDRIVTAQPARPTAVAVLDQADCRFSPHVLAMAVGQTLTVKNGDAEVHNVHCEPSANVAFNFASPPGSSHETSFRSAEFMRVKCDVHPWMTAYIAVLNSSFFAVTDEYGKFEIAGLPPGTYEVTAWQERFGELKQTVEIKDGPAVAKFVYRPPN